MTSRFAGQLAQECGDLPQPEVIDSLVETTVEIFLHYTSQIIMVTSVNRSNAPPEDVAYVFTQRITGDASLCYALALPETLTRVIAAHLLDEAVTTVDAMALDAVTEFVNVVVGNACRKLDVQAWRVTAEPPAVMRRDEIGQLFSGPVQNVSVTMQTSQGDFRAVFLFNDPKHTAN